MSPPADLPGIPFVVAAASGTGKTTVCRRAIERNRERGGASIECARKFRGAPRSYEPLDVEGHRWYFDEHVRNVPAEE